MKRLSLFLALLLAACTQPSYPGIDRPSGGGNTATDQSVIDYIDQRLEAEYYWLDEVQSKCNTFNRSVKWEAYLDNVLGTLNTNSDDGYISSKGQRVFYSYIREVPSTTRSSVTGFGIDLHTTIVVINSEQHYYGFVVENVYEASPAKHSDIRRGDIITMVNKGYITPNNYITLFNSIYANTASQVELQIMRRAGDGGKEETFKVDLTAAPYQECTVAHCEIIRGNKPVGYLVYTGFESESDEALKAALRSFADEGVREIILDLRTNGGGSLYSAITLSSTLLAADHQEDLLCEVRRNPKNTKSETIELFNIEATEFNIGIERLTAIVSNNTASASELVIMGLRGLDIPVTLVGTTTQGKNCGMDVTRRTIGSGSGSLVVEYAPITFMCFNAKGFGEWGDGIAADIDAKALDKNYPLPAAPWGSSYVEYDAALALALESVGYEPITTASTRAIGDVEWPTAATIVKPTKGICLELE